MDKEATGFVLGIVVVLASIFKFHVAAASHDLGKLAVCTGALLFGIACLYYSTDGFLKRHLSTFWIAMIRNLTVLVVLIGCGVAFEGTDLKWLASILAFVCLWPLANIVIEVRNRP